MTAAIVDRARAALWWETKGRALMRDVGGTGGLTNVEQVGRKVSRVGSVAGDIVPVTPSGILNAAPWDKLTAREQMTILRELRAEWSKAQ